MRRPEFGGNAIKLADLERTSFLSKAQGKKVSEKSLNIPAQ